MKMNLTLIFTLAMLFSTKVMANTTEYLIQEMEELRNSLEVDDPARIDLTLRLADLYFDASIKEGEKSSEEAMMESRRKALALYEQSLRGDKTIAPATGLTRIKIEFQMARLLSRLGQNERAEPYYLSVESSELSPSKMKEQASLALAEWYEEDAKYPKAVVFYDKAIKLCDVRTACNYAHYRKAWLYFKDTKLTLAISEMKASLWTTDTEVREASLQDLMLFLSNSETNGEAELSYIKGLADKLDRPELVANLVEAFYVAGNRRAGGHLLAYLNEQSPSLYYQVRLLEEYYGFRNWDQVEHYLKELESRSSADIPAKKEHADEVNKILRRYLVQVDSEAEVIPELNPFLKRSIDVYLTIYPNDDLRKKLQQGWLKAESDEVKKVARLGKWIAEDEALGVDPKEIRKLRQTRLSMAQKLKDTDVVIAESLAIAKVLKGTPEAAEFEYVAAREYYGKKDFASALPLFKGIIDGAVESKNFTNWAILSQNLTLDIYNNQKNFQGIIDQVALWKSASAGVDNKEIAKENSNMDKIQVEARFEQAAKMTDSPESLLAFFNFCFDGVFADKSCPNAKVLAVKFADQDKLVKLLEKEGDEKALMVEYERMGRFTDAAKLHEKLVLAPLKGKLEYEVYLKIALLYELDQKFSERNRILSAMIEKMKREKSIPSELEGAVFLTLDEAGLIDMKSLFLPWSTARKLSLATRLELDNPSQTTQKVILAQEKSVGPVWSKLVLSKVEEEFKKVGSMKFYGRNSQRLFKRRTQAIDRFVTVAKENLEGADLETRVYLLDMLEKTYAKMTEDILATPLPPDLDDETMAQVQIQLQTLAAPFESVRADYEELLTKQLDGYTPEEATERARIEGNIKVADGSYAQFIKEAQVTTAAVINTPFEGVETSQTKLLANSADLGALTELKNYFDTKQMARLSAYYNDRIESLKN